MTDDPELMAELARMYMEAGTPDPELYEYATTHGVQAPADIDQRDKRSLFSVRFPPGSDTGTLEWDWSESEGSQSDP